MQIVIQLYFRLPSRALHRCENLWTEIYNAEKDIQDIKELSLSGTAKENVKNLIILEDNIQRSLHKRQTRKKYEADQSVDIDREPDYELIKDTKNNGKSDD